MRFHFQKLKISKVALLFSSTTIWASFVSMSVGIIMIRWIEPGELGIWQSLSMIQLYLPFLELGVPNGLNRELPYRYGKGEEKQGIYLAQTAQYYMKAVSIILFFITAISALVLIYLDYSKEIFFGALTVGLISSLTSYQRYLTVTYRSAQSFLDISKITFIKSIIQIALFPLVYLFEYYGLLLYNFLLILLHVLIMHFRRPIRIQADFSKKNFSELAKTGMPVFIMGYIRGVASSFSRIILLAKGGAMAVGLYTPVLAIGTLTNILPGILGNYFFPKMNFTLGKSNDPLHLWPLAIKLNVIFFFLTIPFVIIVWWGAPFIILTYFENYKESIRAIQFFSVTLLFSGTLVSHNVIYAVKAYKLGYIFTVIDFLLRYLLPFLIITYIKGNLLTLMSVSIVITNFILFICNLIFIRMALFSKSIDEH